MPPRLSDEENDSRREEQQAEAPSTTSAKYYVSKKADRWNVRYEGNDYSYESSTSALLAAIKAANIAVSQGYAAEVMIQGLDGKWRTEWAEPRMIEGAEQSA